MGGPHGASRKRVTTMSWLVFFLPLFPTTPTYPPFPNARVSERRRPCNLDDDADATRITTTTQQHDDGNNGETRTVTKAQPGRPRRCNEDRNTTTAQRRPSGTHNKGKGPNEDRAGEATTGWPKRQQGR